MPSTGANTHMLFMSISILLPDAIARSLPFEHVQDTGINRTSSNLLVQREEYASLLCGLASKFKLDGNNFKTRRILQIQNRLQNPYVATLMKHRRLDVVKCCDNEGMSAILGCLADNRRRRIDDICSIKAPRPIPFTDVNMVAMETRIVKCCKHVGAGRFKCFNMTSDQIAVSPGEDYSVDETDPLNDIWDYPVNVGDFVKVDESRTTNTKRRDLNQRVENNEDTVVTDNLKCICARDVTEHYHAGLTSLSRSSFDGISTGNGKPRDDDFRLHPTETNALQSTSTQMTTQLKLTDKRKRKRIHPIALIRKYRLREMEGSAKRVTQMPTSQKQGWKYTNQDTFSYPSTKSTPRPRLKPDPGLTLKERVGAVPPVGTRRRGLRSKLDVHKLTGKPGETHLFGIVYSTPVAEASQITIKNIARLKDDKIVLGSPNHNEFSGSALNKTSEFKHSSRVRQRRLKKGKRSHSRRKSSNRRKQYSVGPKTTTPARPTAEIVTHCKYS